jgi:hypothetical protein
VGDFGSCDAVEALATATDAEHVAASARDFMYKPDGGACLACAHAGCGHDACNTCNTRVPAHTRTRVADVSYKMGLSLDQEPSLYTAGTEYLIPGPAGNLYKVPNDPSVRSLLIEQARKALAVYQSVNLPPPPADLQVRLACVQRCRPALC